MSSIQVQSPIDKSVLYAIQDADEAEVRQIYEKARSVFETVRNLSLQERLDACRKIQLYIVEHREEIIDCIVKENGKSRFDCLSNEIFVVLDVLDYYQKHAVQILADQKVRTPLTLRGKRSRIVFEPLGPVLIIAPWNFPLYQSLIPILSAFIAGNSVVFKPSEVTPVRGLIEDILTKGGFIQDAVQVVYGGGQTGKALIEAKPAKILFIGSVATGKKVMSLAGNHLIPVVLELGGKDATIVFEDVQLDKTVNGLLWGALTNCGQACISIERIYVHEAIHDAFVDTLVKRVGLLKQACGDADSAQTEPLDIGTMTAESQVEIVAEHVDDAIAKGARALCGGRRGEHPFHYPATVLVDVDHTMKIMTEETFGPVMAVMKFKTEEEAIRLANDTPYGLGASVWSREMRRAERVAGKMVAGSVSINNVLLTVANPALPFGGVNASGIGRYKGAAGLHAFSNTKSILIDKQNGRIEGHWYPFTQNKYEAFSAMIDTLYSKAKSFPRFVLAGMKLESLAKREKLK